MLQRAWGCRPYRCLEISRVGRAVPELAVLDELAHEDKRLRALGAVLKLLVRLPVALREGSDGFVPAVGHPDRAVGAPYRYLTSS